MSWNGSGPTSALWSGNGKIQPPTSNYEYLNVRFLSTTLTTASTINAINVNAININSSDVNTNTLSTFQVHLSSNTILTGGNASLYINGILVTDASNASNVSQWADFPAITDINANNKNIINLTSLFGSNLFASNIYNSQNIWSSNINTSTLNVRGQFTGSNITASNILIRNTVSAANGNFTTTSANDGNFVNTTSIFTNTTLLASVNGTITTLSNTNFKSRTANISNFYGKLMYGENLFLSSIIALSNIYGATIEGETLDVGTIITDTDIYGSNLFVSTIITEGLTAGGIQIGATILEVLDWNPNTLYGSADVVLYSNVFYVATNESRNQAPTSNIPLWENNSSYLRGNYSLVEGVGSYRCTNNIAGSTTSPNGDLANWAFFSDTADPTMWNVTTEPTLTSIGAIVGDGFSYITVGTGNFNTLNAPVVTSSNFLTSNIFSQNINNTNLITTNTLTATGAATLSGGALVSGLNVTNNSQLNTLTTSGIVNTNNILNVNGLLALQSDMYGQTQNVPIIAPPFSITQYLRSIYDIKNLTVERIDVVGGATGNFAFDYRENSIVNIGETELSPGIVTIYGANAELTTALTVYGITSITGDTTINGLNTVNGLTDLNGDLTVLGLTSITGDTDIIGLVSITGNTDINGACEITGETNILGLLTAEAGIGIAGATTIQGGDITIGSSSGGVTNNFNVYIYYNGLDVENITVNGNGDFRQNVSILGDLTARNFITSNVTASNLNVRRINGIGPTSNIFLNGNLIFEDSNASRSTNFEYLYTEEFEAFSINSDENLLLIGQSNLVMNAGLNCAVTSQQITSIAAGVEVNITADTRIQMTTQGEFFGQGATFTFNASSNLIMEATEALAITGGTQTIIGSTNGNVTLGAVGSNLTSVINLDGGPIIIASSNTAIGLVEGSINFECPIDITLTAGNNVTIAGSNDAIFFAQGGAGIGGSNLSLLALNQINITGSNVLTELTGNYTMLAEKTVDIQANSNIDLNAPNGRVAIGAEKEVLIYGQNLVTIQSLSNVVINAPNLSVLQSISTLRISTGILNTNGISSLNIQASNIFTSTLRATNTMTASTIAIDRIVGNASATNVFTNNLFPLSAGAQLGFGPALGSGGYYNFGFHRSTFTTNINPATDGATTSNNIKVAGHLSTVSLGVSTINFKQYPFISTLSNAVVTADASVSGTAVLTRLQSNALRFPFPGTYNITQKYSLTKSAGGTNQHTHGSLVYDSNTATTTTVANALNWSRMGMDAVPVMDKTGFSTFTTLTTTILANTANLTRDLYYYDFGSGTYTASFYIAPPTIEYIPSPGILPDI